MDIPANSYFKNIIVSGVIVVVPTLLVIGLLIVAASRSKQREKDYDSKNKLIALVSENVQAPLEGVVWATEKLKNSPTITQDPEASQIAQELSRSVSKVNDTVKDIINASSTGASTKKIELTDRVDLVALMIDTIDSFRLSASTKNVSIMLGSTWPASFVFDTNLDEFNRMINGLITYSLSRTAANNNLFFTYLTDSSSWSVIAFNNNLSPHDQNTIALTTVRVHALGGEVSVDPDTKGIMVRFLKSGNEITR